MAFSTRAASLPLVSPLLLLLLLLPLQLSALPHVGGLCRVDPHCSCHSAEKLSCVAAPFPDLAYVHAHSGLATLRDLSISNCNIPELSDTALRGLDLHVLSLKANGIAVVHRRVFQGQRSLRFLQLASNNIRHLHRDTFVGLNELSTLSLNDNFLTDVGALHNLSNIVHLTIRNNYISALEKYCFSCPKLRFLDLAENDITCIESGAFDATPNLEVLDLSENHIMELPRDAFRNMSLFELRLSRNKLSDLDFAQNISTMRILIMSHNTISTMPRMALSGATELYHLDLAHNKISTILRSAFEGLLNLGDLDLSHNRLSSFHTHTFFGTPYLQRLNLEHNRLTRLDFAQCSLTHLYMGWNAVISLQPWNWGCAGRTLQVLDLSDNPLAEVRAEALSGMAGLSTLHVQHAALEKIEDDTLAAAAQITDVDFSYNRLKVVQVQGAQHLRTLRLHDNAITTLVNGTFANVSLEHPCIDLANNGIQVVESYAFHGLIEGATLNLSRNNISHLHNNTFRTLVNIWDLDLSYNSLSEMNFLRNISSMRQLNVSHNIITSIHNYAFLASTIPLLFYLDASSNSISLIEKYAFYGLKNVWDMNLSNNRISSLAKETFKDLTSLWDLNLSRNNLSSLEWLSIPSLRQLNLSSNSLTVLSNSVLSNLNTTVLTQLDLSRNGLQILEEGALSGLRQLERIDLSNNALRDVPASALATPALLHLDLSDNSLSAAPTLPLLPLLSTYDLSGNAINTLTAAATANAPHLRILRVARNHLATLDNTSVTLPRLQELDLSNNRIITVDQGALAGCSALLVLDLRGNMLTHIPPLHLNSLRHLILAGNDIRDLSSNAFVDAAIPAIAYLDLSNNAVQIIDPAAFQQLRVLKYLDLSVNGITTLHPGTFANNSVLWALDISSNQLSQLETIRDHPGLEILNASRNLIRALVHKQGTKGRANRLTVLDLSHNGISAVKNRAFAGLGRLSVLDVSHNRLQRLPVSVLDDVRRLQVLRYVGNPLTRDSAAALARRAVALAAGAQHVHVADAAQKMRDELERLAQRLRLRWST